MSLKLGKLLRRCGCAERLNLEGVTQGPWTCCEDCVDAPCFYVILSPCTYYMPDGEEVLRPGLVMAKDCIRGCKWSARYTPDGTPAANFTASPYALTACQETGESGLTLTISGTETSPCYWPVETDDLFRKVTLGHSAGGMAILQLTTLEGAVATYSASEVNCKEPTTFYIESRDPVLHFLPPTLCIQPYESEPEHVCATAADQCACNDPGYDYGQFYMEINGCDGDLAFVGTVTSDRYFSASTWPCGITFPSPAPCGAFLYTIPLGDCGNDVKMVIWCDGTEYKGKAYCYDDDTACWVEQGDVEIIPPSELRCTDVHLVIRLPALDCCCGGGCQQDCPSFDTENPTLNVSFAASGCAAIDGCVQEISNGGSGYTWDATSTNCFSTVTLSKDETDCWKLTLQASECISATYDAVSVTCDPPEIVFEFTFTPSGSGCCSGATTTVTATVTL